MPVNFKGEGVEGQRIFFLIFFAIDIFIFFETKCFNYTWFKFLGGQPEFLGGGLKKYHVIKYQLISIDWYLMA